MNVTDQSYKRWLENIKQKIKSTQLKVAQSVSVQMLEMYWQLAEEIVSKEQTANWGDGVLEQLSIDLRLSFPNINGFSRRNLYAIRQWYLFYQTHSEFVPQAVAQIPWGHNAGKLNFYLSAVDSQLKHPTDNNSIGLILCKHKDKVEAEYALRDIQKPIGISEYLLTQTLPENFKSQLPTVEQLETQLNLKEDHDKF